MAKGKHIHYLLIIFFNFALYTFREQLQSLDLTSGPKLSPRTLFKNNKQIIRCSWCDLDVSMTVYSSYILKYLIVIIFLLLPTLKI